MLKELIKNSLHSFKPKLAENVKQDSKSFYRYVKGKQQIRDGICSFKAQNSELSVDSKFKFDELSENICKTKTEYYLMFVMQYQNL